MFYALAWLVFSQLTLLSDNYANQKIINLRCILDGISDETHGKGTVLKQMMLKVTFSFE